MNTTRYLVPLLLAPIANAQFLYDFNNLNGSDQHPYTLLDGQDNWTEQTYNAANRCGVTATLSHDGTQSLRFQEVGPGYGCDASRINDGNWLFPAFSGTETNAMFQADMLVGYWGGSFGLGHDTNTDTLIRSAQAGELGVRFTVGTQTNVQFRLYAADQTFVQVPLTSLGTISGGQWLRVRVVMDLAAGAGTGTGSVFVRNLTLNAPGFTAVPGLQDIPLALDQNALDATNPTLWDAVWLHFEGATYGLDNIDVGRGGFAAPFGTPCSGTGGPTVLVGNGRQPGTTLTLESGNHAANALGVTILGFGTTTYLSQPLPYLLDPVYGTSGCSLFIDVVVPAFGLTSATAPATLSLNLAVPSGAWTGTAFFAQHACFEPVPGNMSFSNALRVQLP